MKKANKLQEFLSKNKYTQEELNTFRKLEKYFYIEDLLNTLNELLENESITEKEYDLAVENYDIIIEKYGKWLDYDWQSTMEDAINYIIKGGVL